MPRLMARSTGCALLVPPPDLVGPNHGGVRTTGTGGAPEIIMGSFTFTGVINRVAFNQRVYLPAPPQALAEMLTVQLRGPIVRAEEEREPDLGVPDVPMLFAEVEEYSE